MSPIVTRVIEVIADKLGLEEASRRVNVPEALLMAWRDGHATIPREKFLRLIDLLLELNIGWDDWNGG